MKKLLLAAIAGIFMLGGCEDTAKRVKSDPSENKPRQTHEQGQIDTH